MPGLLPIDAAIPRRVVPEPALTDAEQLLSASDSLPKAREKMERRIENGATLGWRIDPYKKKVYVYAPGSETAVESASMVRGQGPVEGFTLDLDELRRCYEV